jgi:hypothetical protein
VTVHESLLASGANDREAVAAESLIARVVPLGRPVVLTEDVLAAARAGDAALVALLLADEVLAEPDDADAVEESLRAPAGERVGSANVRERLGLA